MSALATVSITLPLATLADTHALGKRLGAMAVVGQVIALNGDLGAGKTTLTQGIAAGLGINARVTSPTFTLVNEYDAGTRGLRLIHMDTYRLGESLDQAHAEATNLGLDEIFATASLPDHASNGAVVVIEWAERVADLLPPDTLYITLTADADDPNARTVALIAHHQVSSAFLAKISEK